MYIWESDCAELPFIYLFSLQVLCWIVFTDVSWLKDRTEGKLNLKGAGYKLGRL